VIGVDTAKITEEVDEEGGWRASFKNERQAGSNCQALPVLLQYNTRGVVLH
jgi:hypothetical protein